MIENGFKVKMSGDVAPLEAASGKAVASLNKISAASGAMAVKASRDFTGLSRVIQDLPFGFLAIQNNITQLLPATGALGLGLSLVTAGLTFAQTGLSNWTRGFGGATKAAEDHVRQLKEAREALDNYVQSLSDVSRMRVEGAQSAQQELIHLQTLYNATQNLNIPLQERKHLVDQLQDQYPAYFQNLSDETILAGGAEAAYRKLSDAILSTARVRAGEKILQDIEEQSIGLAEKRSAAIANEANARRELNQANQEAKSAGGTEEFVAGTAQAAARAQERFNEARKDRIAIEEQILSLGARSQKLSQNIQDTIAATPGTLTDPGARVKEIKIKPDKITIDPARNIEFAAPDQFFQDNKSGFKAPTGFAELLEKSFSGITVRPHIQFDFSQSKDPVEDALNFLKLQKLNNLIEENLQKIGLNAATAFGDAIGAAITGGDIGGVFNSLFSMIGGAMRELGVQMIALSPLMQAIKLAIKTLNPGVLLGAGIGLVAIGSAIQGAFAHVKGFAAGGLVTGPTLGMIGEGTGTSKANPEIIAPLDKLKDYVGAGVQRMVMPEGTWRIRGKDLVFVMAQSQKSQRRTT